MIYRVQLDTYVSIMTQHVRLDRFSDSQNESVLKSWVTHGLARWLPQAAVQTAGPFFNGWSRPLHLYLTRSLEDSVGEKVVNMRFDA